MENLFTSHNLLALLTLTLLEVVLGVDNLVVIAILSNKLPKNRQNFARRLGLGLAMGMRILLLLTLSWIMKLTAPLFGLFGHPISGRDLVMIIGGAFLIYKATHEIHSELEGETHTEAAQRKAVSFMSVIVQIVVLDLVFSLDSVITAVGMAEDIRIMIAAVIIAVIAMMLFANSLSGIIEKHPTIKMLALSFLLLIGFTLTIEGFGKHIEKGYIYSAMGFSLLVELINLKMRKGHSKIAHEAAPAVPPSTHDAAPQ